MEIKELAFLPFGLLQYIWLEMHSGTAQPQKIFAITAAESPHSPKLQQGFTQQLESAGEDS